MDLLCLIKFQYVFLCLKNTYSKQRIKVSLEIEKYLLNNTPHLVVTCLKALDANVEYFTTFKIMRVLSIFLIDCLSVCPQFLY